MFDAGMKGKAGEKLVEFDLLCQGVEVFVPAAYGGNQDLLAVFDNETYKVQVKVGTVKDLRLIVDVRKSSNSKDRLYSDGDYDILAVVHIESRRVGYIRREDMTAKNSVNIWMRNGLSRRGLRVGHEPLMFDDLADFPTR